MEYFIKKNRNNILIIGFIVILIIVSIFIIKFSEKEQEKLYDSHINTDIEVLDVLYDDIYHKPEDFIDDGLWDGFASEEEYLAYLESLEMDLPEDDNVVIADIIDKVYLYQFESAFKLANNLARRDINNRQNQSLAMDMNLVVDIVSPESESDPVDLISFISNPDILIAVYNYLGNEQEDIIKVKESELPIVNSKSPLKLIEKTYMSPSELPYFSQHYNASTIHKKEIIRYEFYISKHLPTFYAYVVMDYDNAGQNQVYYTCYKQAEDGKYYKESGEEMDKNFIPTRWVDVSHP